MCIRDRDSGVAELLSEVAANRRGTLSGARSVHPVDEAEEHASSHHGAGADYAPGAGILRLRTLELMGVQHKKAPAMAGAFFVDTAKRTRPAGRRAPSCAGPARRHRLRGREQEWQRVEAADGRCG